MTAKFKLDIELIAILISIIVDKPAHFYLKYVISQIVHKSP